MASVSGFVSPSCSAISLGFRTRSRRESLGSLDLSGPQPHGSGSGLAKANRFHWSFCVETKALAVRQRRHGSGVVLCSGRGYEVATMKLIAAKKKRALYATKLLIEAPLMGVCALTVLTVWAHWGPTARANGAPLDVYASMFIRADIDLLDFYAITPAWAGVAMLFARCVEDLCELGRAAKRCCKLRKKLPSDFKEPSTLDWDSDDERNFEAEQGELKSIATDAVFVEALVLSTWAAGNVYLPPTNDYDIWRRNVFLCAFPVAWVSYVVQQACTCLALEAMKRGAQNRDT